MERICDVIALPVPTLRTQSITAHNARAVRGAVVAHSAMLLLGVPLPDGVLDYLLSYLTHNDRLALRRVCQQWKCFYDQSFPSITAKELRITQKLKENPYSKHLEIVKQRSNLFRDMVRCMSPNPSALLLDQIKFNFDDLVAFKGDCEDQHLDLDLETTRFISQYVDFNRIFITNIHFDGTLLSKFGELLSYFKVQEIVVNNCDFSLILPEEISAFIRSLYTGITSIDIRFGDGFEKIKFAVMGCTRYFQNLSEISMKPSIELDEENKILFYSKDITQLLPLSQQVSKFKLSGMATTWNEVMNLCANWCTAESPSSIIFFPYLINLQFMPGENDFQPIQTVEITTMNNSFVAFEIEHYTRRQFHLSGRCDKTGKSTKPKFKLSLQTKINLKFYRTPALNVRYAVNNKIVPQRNFYCCKSDGDMFYDQGELSFNARTRFDLTIDVSRETVFAIVCACNYKENVSNEKEFVVTPGERKILSLDLSKSACKRVCLYGWVLTDELRGLSPWLCIRPNPEFMNMCCTFIRFNSLK